MASCNWFSIISIKLFIKSLREYYDGKVCFIIGSNDFDIEIELKKYNCDCIKTKIDKRDIQLKRYKIFFRVLNKKEI